MGRQHQTAKLIGFKDHLARSGLEIDQLSNLFWPPKPNEKALRRLYSGHSIRLTSVLLAFNKINTILLSKEAEPISRECILQASK